jgi:hypothetical protein
MGIEDLKWWHWGIISLVVGYALAYANSMPPEPVGLTEQQVIEFERDVLHAPIGADHRPWVRNLIVYPMVEKGAAGRPAQVVMYDAAYHKPGTPDGTFTYRHCWYCAAVPYVTAHQPPSLQFAVGDYPAQVQAARKNLPPGIEKTYVPKTGETLESITAAVYGKYTAAGQEAIATANQAFRKDHSIQKLIQGKRWSAGQAVLVPFNPSDKKTVQDWLDSAAKDYSWVHYKFAWWKMPQYCNLVWMGSTFAVVGVIWPMALSVMSGAGLGRPKKKGQAYDMSRFGTGVSKAKVPGSQSQEMSEEHQKQLTSLNESLRASVKDGLQGGQPAAPEQKADSAAVPGRQFVPSAPGVAVAAPTPEAPQESKDFTGEFYPVARPTIKAEPDQHKPADPHNHPKLP